MHAYLALSFACICLCVKAEQKIYSLVRVFVGSFLLSYLMSAGCYTYNYEFDSYLLVHIKCCILLFIVDGRLFEAGTRREAENRDVLFDS